MNVRLLLIAGVLVLAAGAPSAFAQSSADAYFHRAAQQYVDGREAAARRIVQRGLEVAPSDRRLQALWEKLQRQESRQRGSGQSGQSGQSDAQAQDPSTGQEGEEKTEREAQSPADQGRGGQGSSSEEGSDSPQEKADAPAQSGQEEEQGGRATPLSRAQARRLLQALEAQEKKLLRQLRVRGLEKKSVEKDW